MAVITKWSYLKRARRSGLARVYPILLVAVPLIASISVSVEDYTQIRVPAPVNLLILYGSALFFTIGSLVFDQFCPKPIAEYEGRFRFTEDWISHHELIARRSAEFDQAIEALSVRVVGALRLTADSQDERERKVFLERELNDLITKEIERDAIVNLDQIWEKEEMDRFYARLAVQLMYLSSGVMALYITFIDAPERVLRYLF